MIRDGGIGRLTWYSRLVYTDIILVFDRDMRYPLHGGGEGERQARGWDGHGMGGGLNRPERPSDLLLPHGIAHDGT